MILIQSLSDNNINNHSNWTAHALHITLLDIPSPLVIGESVELTCNYDLDDHTLYSFKWYKDGTEFYRYEQGLYLLFSISSFPFNIRYVPRDYPQTQYLKLSGINVDVSEFLVPFFVDRQQI